MNTKAPNIADVIFPQALREILLTTPVVASDGTLWRTAEGARRWEANQLLGDLIARKIAEVKAQAVPAMRDVAQIIRARSDLRVSQVELAREAGVSLSLLHKIERHERAVTESVADRLWGALWRLQNKIPDAVELFVRLEKCADGSTTGVTTCREKVKGI